MGDVVQPIPGNASANAVAPAKGYFRGALLNPGTAVCTLLVYDNTTATGTPILELRGAANGQSVQSFDFAIPLSKGLSVTLTGAGAGFILYIG